MALVWALLVSLGFRVNNGELFNFTLYPQLLKVNLVWMVQVQLSVAGFTNLESHLQLVVQPWVHS